GLASWTVLELADGLGRAPEAVGDRVAGDGVEPRCARPAIRLERLCRAPDRDEGVLRRVFGSSPVANPSEGEAEHGSRVPAVQLVERSAVAARDAHDELAVRRLWKLHTVHGPGSYPRGSDPDRERRSHVVVA